MRKKVLFIGMLVTLLFAFSGCGTKNEGVVTLIMSDVQEGDHPTAQACDKFAELVKKKRKSCHRSLSWFNTWYGSGTDSTGNRGWN